MRGKINFEGAQCKFNYNSIAVVPGLEIQLQYLVLQQNQQQRGVIETLNPIAK